MLENSEILVVKYSLDLNKLETFYFLKIGQVDWILSQFLSLRGYRERSQGANCG